jgi:hypothetical protein
MFLLSFIPDALILWIVNAILLAGIAGSVISFFFGFFIRWMPWILPYRMLLQIISLVLLIAGVYFKGGVGVEMEWRARVAEMEAKVAKAEAESKEANSKIQTKVVEKIRVVKEKEIVIQEKIANVKVTIDSQCKVSPEAISILNEAAKKPENKK